jgi:hypothetical protein
MFPRIDGGDEIGMKIEQRLDFTTLRITKTKTFHTERRRKEEYITFIFRNKQSIINDN